MWFYILVTIAFHASQFYGSSIALVLYLTLVKTELDKSIVFFTLFADYDIHCYYS